MLAASMCSRDGGANVCTFEGRLGTGNFELVERWKRSICLFSKEQSSHSQSSLQALGEGFMSSNGDQRNRMSVATGPKRLL